VYDAPDVMIDIGRFCCNCNCAKMNVVKSLHFPGVDIDTSGLKGVLIDEVRRVGVKAQSWR
jgi:hypothetical protein